MIRIVFTASSKWASRAIRWLTNGRVSHVFGQWPCEVWGGDWATEATWPMVISRPAELARHNIYREFECLFDAKKALHDIRHEVGQWYDFKGFALVGLWLLFCRIVKNKIKYPFHNTKGDLCSELYSKMLKKALLADTIQMNPEFTTPEDLLKYCEAHLQYFRELPKG